jgi:hypothetical protein
MYGRSYSESRINELERLTAQWAQDVNPGELVLVTLEASGAPIKILTRCFLMITSKFIVGALSFSRLEN